MASRTLQEQILGTLCSMEMSIMAVLFLGDIAEACNHEPYQEISYTVK